MQIYYGWLGYGHGALHGNDLDLCDLDSVIHACSYTIIWTCAIHVCTPWLRTCNQQLAVI